MTYGPDIALWLSSAQKTSRVERTPKLLAPPPSSFSISRVLVFVWVLLLLLTPEVTAQDPATDYCIAFPGTEQCYGFRCFHIVNSLNCACRSALQRYDQGEWCRIPNLTFFYSHLLNDIIYIYIYISIGMENNWALLKRLVSELELIGVLVYPLSFGELEEMTQPLLE